MENIALSVSEIENHLDAILNSLAKMLPTDEIKNFKEKRQQQKEELEKQIKLFHPDDKHWPPHPNCPICAKVMSRRAKIIRDAINVEQG